VPLLRAVSIKKLAAFFKRFGPLVLGFSSALIFVSAVFLFSAIVLLLYIYIYKLGVLLGIRNYVPVCISSEWPLNDHHNSG
jgi:hypothetical protein